MWQLMYAKLTQTCGESRIECSLQAGNPMEEGIWCLGVIIFNDHLMTL